VIAYNFVVNMLKHVLSLTNQNKLVKLSIQCLTVSNPSNANWILRNWNV